MKKITAVILALMMFLSSTSAMAYEGADDLPDFSQYSARIMVDGKYVDSKVLPIPDGKSAFFPFRAIMENAGYEVLWDSKENLAIAKGEKGELYSLNLKTKNIIKNGEAIKNDINYYVNNGSTYISPDFFEIVDGVNASWDRSTKTAIISTDSPSDNLYVYDLGEGKINTSLGKELPYQMQGIVGVPKNDNAPIAIILHGAHPVDVAKNCRYDLGFSYLVDSLADAGYLVIAPNIAINYSWENGEPMGSERSEEVLAQLSEKLSLALKGEYNGFGVDLKDKGDLEQVVLIGHSRAGLDILKFSKTKDFNTVGMLLVAPAMYTTSEHEVIDVPTSIIMSQLDGDVLMLDGQNFYEQLAYKDDRKSTTELIYLKNANHNYFDEAILRKDYGVHFKAEIKIPLMEANEQREFLRSYTLDFMDSVINSNTTPNDKAQRLPSKLYGKDILMSVARTKDIELYSAAANNENEIVFNNIDAKYVNASYIPINNTVSPFNIPGMFKDYPLLNVKFNNNKGSMTISPKTKAFSNADYISFYLAQDSSNTLNSNKNQAFTVELKDTSGKTKKVLCGMDTPALSYQEGEILTFTGWDNSVSKIYSTFNPISGLKIPLSEFSELNLNAIESISIYFDQTNSGSIMIKNVLLGQYNINIVKQ